MKWISRWTKPVSIQAMCANAGIDYVAFTKWAIDGEEGIAIHQVPEKWNTLHPDHPIKASDLCYDSVKMMIALFKEQA